MTQAAIITITCESCKKVFYPHGRKRFFPPTDATYECPHCGKKNYVIFDKQLSRELARKELGLDKELNEKVKLLDLENKELKIELKSLKEKVEANTNSIDELRDIAIPQLRKQVANEIAKLMVIKAKKKSSFEPV